LPATRLFRLQLCRSFAAPRKVQSTAPRRTAHLENTNTPRAPFFSVRAAVRTICSYFNTSSKPFAVACFAPLPSRWTLLSKVSVAVRIMIVVVHVGRRLRSLVQLLTLLSGISCRSPTHGAKHVISSGSLLCKEWALFNLAPAHRASR